MSPSTDSTIEKDKDREALEVDTINIIEEECEIINNTNIVSTTVLNNEPLSTELPSTSNASKKVNRTLPSQPPTKRFKRDDLVKDEFLKIAKTQSDALMVSNILKLHR